LSAPASPGRAQLTERLIVDFGAAFQQRAVYAPGHPQVNRALDRLLTAFAAWCAHAATAEVSLIILEGQLLVDREAIPEDAPWARGLLQALRRHGIRGLTMVVGLDTAELGLFFDACQSAQGPTASRHILLGQAGFAAGDPSENAGAAGPASSSAPSSLSPEQVESARAELFAVATGAVTRIDRLRSFVARLARSADAGALDSPRLIAADLDDREFLHGLGVSLATLRLARALRIEGNALEDLVLSGLVHDVGYLEAARPEEDPAERRRLHPIRGAARLAALEGIPDIAVLVAYEHHLRFDGAPNYPPMAIPRQPIAAARVVAVADTWETLRSQGETRPAEALAILRDRAGTFLDPALVELFAALMLPPAP
jgi:HD-GYP domain-containing protein (c-di-GMP phosphodiesterase class II)